MMEQWIATRFSLMMVLLLVAYYRMLSAPHLRSHLHQHLHQHQHQHQHQRRDEEEALVAVVVRVHAIVGTSMCVVRREEDHVGQKNGVGWMYLLIMMSMTVTPGAAAAAVAAEGQFHRPR
jgi:hypothetical protein